MSTKKLSYKDKYENSEKPKQGSSKKGSEFGAVIKNDPKNYPQTGQWRDRRPVIDKDKCIGCGMCVANCPEAAICLMSIGDKKKAKVDYQFCKGEGICAQICPVKAIKMEKE
jgi:pyruvate ferredoxin oxidoreductase delta subunit